MYYYTYYIYIAIYSINVIAYTIMYIVNDKIRGVHCTLRTHTYPSFLPKWGAPYKVAMKKLEAASYEMQIRHECAAWQDESI